jgi:tripartite-type tricarboxylate transporter receptor subunit TctC
MKQLSLVAVLVGLATGFGAAQAAEDYPTGPVKLVAGSSAGGGTDIFARLLAHELELKWTQPVVVENVPGASGTVAATEVATSPGDGYTLLFTNSQFITSPVTMNIKYDPKNDFIPIAKIAENPQVFVINPKTVPVTTFDEFVAAAKERPGEINFAHNGVSSTAYIGVVRLMKELGFELTGVPYQTGSAGLTAVLSGEVTAQMGTIAQALPHIKEGTISALAVATNTRNSALPDVPTIEEVAHVENFDISSWYAVLTPKGTPKEIVDRIYQDIEAVLATPDIQQKIADLGAEPAQPRDPAEMATYISDEIDLWRKLITEFAPEAVARND